MKNIDALWRRFLMAHDAYMAGQASLAVRNAAFIKFMDAFVSEGKNGL